MKSLFVVIVIILTLTCTGWQSAIARANDQSARLVDEYGDINYEDEIARLDNFAIELQNDPGAKAHVVIYRSRRDLPGLNYRRGFMVKHYLTSDRGIHPERVAIIEGGIRSCMSVELWLVPAGAAPPPLKETYTYSLSGFTARYKYDEHGYSLPHDVDAFDELGPGSGGVAPGLLAGYAEALKKESDARAFIIAYEQYCRDCWHEGENQRPKVLRDPRGTARRMLKDEKEILVKKYGISPARIVTVNGGHRPYRAVELFVVPKGADGPVPSPSVIPPNNGRR